MAHLDALMPEVLAAESRAISGCPICSRLPDNAEPMPAMAGYVCSIHALGPARCDWCRTPYQVDFSADYEGRRIERRSANACWTKARAGQADALDQLDEWLDTAHLEWPGPVPDADDPLHFLVGNDMHAAIESLLAQGADPNPRNVHQWTPLMRAAISEDATALRLLIDAGAEIDARNLVGETALYLAAEAGRADNVRHLLAAGADPTIPCKGPSAASKRLGIRGVAAAGTTPAQIARELGHDAVVEVL